MNAAHARAVGSPWPWLLSAALLVVFTGGVWAIGGLFVYGEGHAERPIWTFLALYALGWVGFAAAAVALRRSAPPPMVLVLGVAMLTRGLLLDSDLVQASDVYRYVLDGEAVVHGVNPYAHAPAALPDAAPERFRAALAAEDAQSILGRVSYPDVPTVYPPLAQAAFAAGAVLSPWSWFGQRIVFTACDVATIGFLLALLTRLRLPRAYVLLYAWNPLVLKEIANSAHVDSLAALCIVASVYAAVRGNDDFALRWPALCGLVLGEAVLAKLYPLILLPALAVYWFKRANGPRNVFAFLSVCSATVLIGYAPFMGVGFDAITEGLRRYAGEWQRNEGLFALIAAAVPEYARAISVMLVGVVALVLAIHMRGEEHDLAHSSAVDPLIRAVQYTLLAWFLLLPAPYPWYATGLLAICALRPRAWAVVLSGALAIYYYSFLHEYRNHPDAWLLWAQAIEHGVIVLAVVATAFHGSRTRRKLNAG